MTTYFIILLIPILASLVPWRAVGLLSYLQWFGYAFVLIIIIGYRHEVGGDWFGYIRNSAFQTLVVEGVDYYGNGDIAYDWLYWFSANYLNGIYATNLICAIIFISGLWRLCSITPYPWVSVAISIPFFVVVVAMGYTRQSAAVGFFLWGLVDLLKGRVNRYYIFIIIGAFFHKTVIFMFIYGYLYNFQKKKLFKLLIFLSSTLALLAFFMLGKIEFFVYNYITNTIMTSHGAIVRVLMNIMPSLLLFYNKDKWIERYSDYKLWFLFAISSISLLPLSFYFSTFADRIAIYFIPIQIVVLTRMLILINSTYYRTLFLIFIFTLYFIALFIWLFYGVHSLNWIPYRNFLLQ
jgi:hypothetical protein